jgi:hypothetical protein
MEPVIIYRTFNLPDAQMVAARLEAAGFHPELRDEFVSLNEGMSAPFGGVKVTVPSTEEAEVRAFLAPE